MADTARDVKSLSLTIRRRVEKNEKKEKASTKRLDFPPVTLSFCAPLPSPPSYKASFERGSVASWSFFFFPIRRGMKKKKNENKNTTKRLDYPPVTLFVPTPPPLHPCDHNPDKRTRSPYDSRSLRFNREISNIRWPPRLETLEFLGELQQRVEHVAWPRSLRYLSLLGDFDQCVSAVEWPPELKAVRFGNRFRQPLDRVRWPARLETVVLGCGFDKSLVGCVWPAGLRHLTVPSTRLLVASSGGDGDGGGGGGGGRGAGGVVALPACCVVHVLPHATRFSRICVMFPGRSDEEEYVLDEDDEDGSDEEDDFDDDPDLPRAPAVVEVGGAGSSWDDEDELLEMGRSEEGFGGGMDVFGFEDEAWDVGGGASGGGGGDGRGAGGDGRDGNDDGLDGGGDGCDGGSGSVDLGDDLDVALGFDLGVDLDGDVDVDLTLR